ncbi:MAG: hypothetical protein DRP88_04355 [Candidatus Neomarinimicrobiota bacterium]|nr:MAG: hypothetical protein DRP88_04355 [Candidatus Neomarinimicrobiota bacterium]
MKKYHRRKKKKKLSYFEKTILIYILPISIISAFIISFMTIKFPMVLETIIVNVRKEAFKSAKVIRGSAVRVETNIRKKYEETYRAKVDTNWQKKYLEILQNTEKQQVK